VAVPGTPSLETANYIHRPFDDFGERPLGALGRTDGTLELWDLAGGRLTRSWPAGTNAVTAVAFAPGGTRLATGDAAAQVRLWEVATGRELAVFPVAEPPRYPGENQVAALSFSADGKRLATGCWPGFETEVLVFDLEAGALMHHLEHPFGNVTTVALSPDGQLLACATMSGRTEIHLWDLSSRQTLPPRLLRGHVTGVVEVEFSPDGKTLASGGYDTVRLWNVATEREVLSLPAKGALRTLCFSPDGQTLAAGYQTYPGHRVQLYRAPQIQETSGKVARMSRSTP
jgi:WD40 repeat protein